MAEPTDEQLREYAAKLPDLYKEIFEAFYRAEPRRADGEPVRSHTLIEDVISTCDYAESEIADALEMLCVQTFLSRKSRIEPYVPPPLIGGPPIHFVPYFAPTPLGERLMTAVTGKRPRKLGAPPLPEPTWK